MLDNNILLAYECDEINYMQIPVDLSNPLSIAGLRVTDPATDRISRGR
jgi:hypothetical protein